VLIALNPDTASRWFDVIREGEFFSYRLTGRSVATFVWQGARPGDYDGDGDVDLDDYEHFPGCMTGPDGGPIAGECDVFDFEPDDDVDLADFAEFQVAFLGGVE
jgi:hypothetical protein